MGLTHRYDAAEVIFRIETYSAPADTLQLDIVSDAPIFVFYDQLDSDSLITYNAKLNPLQNCPGVCIQNVIRGQVFYVIMDWPTAGSVPWSINVTCTPMSTRGDTCERPILNSLASICTAGYRNDYNMLSGNCSQGPSHPGADLVYQLCLRPHGQLRVRMTDQCAFFSSMYLFTDCANPEGSCVASVADLAPDILPEPMELAWANPADTSRIVYLAADNICPDVGSRRFPFGYRANLTATTYDQCDPQGACCRSDGVCVQRSMAECSAMAGAYFMGVGTPCDPNPCSFAGACCYPSGQCAIRPTQQDCQQYGTWMGSGTDCSPNPCGGNQGACCWPNGTCTLTGPPPQCLFAWHGPGTVCVPNTCPQPPTGACCIGTTCSIDDGYDCSMAGGSYKGNNTTCAPTNPCDLSGAAPGTSSFATRLVGAVPNPFTGTTSLRFTMAHAGPVELELYDAGGRMVRRLFSFSPAGPGALDWDARGADGQRLPPGVYYCRFSADGQRQAGPVILIE
jgi:hypothetical protein